MPIDALSAFTNLALASSDLHEADHTDNDPGGFHTLPRLRPRLLQPLHELHGAATCIAPGRAASRHAAFLSTAFGEEPATKEAAVAKGAQETDSGGSSDGPEVLEFKSESGKVVNLCGKDEECCMDSCKKAPELNKDKKPAGVDSPKAAEVALNMANGGDQKAQADCNRFCRLEFEMYCFPGDSTVLVHGRGLVPLAALHIGDEVLALQWCDQDDGRDGRPVGWKLRFEKVVSFLHHDPDVEADVLCIHHELGKIQLTPNHFVFVQADSAVLHRKAVPTLAHEVSAGDRLLAPWIDGSLTSPKVQAVERVRKKGMYAPLLQGGALFVDGTAASCYAMPSNIANSAMYRGLATAAGTSNIQEIINGLFMPLHVLYQLPSIPGLTSLRHLRPGAEAAEAKNGEVAVLAKPVLAPIHPYADMLYHIASVIMR